MKAKALALAAALITAGLSVAFVAGEAHAWELFRRPNPEVEAGNEHLRADRPSEALAAYDRAARQLPDEPGVALDRGLALLAGDEADEALEAFLRAAEPPAPEALRADAYYDRGVALMRQAETHAESEAREEAQDRFRLAAESFRRSLAARPGNRDAAWNLELALRRLHEEEEKQADEEQAREKQDPQQQDPSQQDPQQQQQDPSQQDPQQQDPSQQDPQQQQDPSQQGSQDRPQPGAREEPPGQAPRPDEGQRGPSETLPSEAARILDSLQDNEENLERLRARARALRERRVPTKDW